MEPCKHSDFKAAIDVNYLEDIGRWIAVLKLECGICNLPFHFVGVPEYGMLMTQPALEVGGCEIRLPIAPGALTPDQIREMQFDMRGAAGTDRVVLPIQDFANLTAEVAVLQTQIDALKEVIRVNAICHDLHGKVGAVEFAAGCANEQRKLYGCAPDADARLKAERERDAVGRGSLPCDMCGLPVVFEFTVGSAIWNRIVREKGLNEYLCLWCFAKLAGDERVEVGVNIHAGNVWSMWCGDDVCGTYPGEITKKDLEQENARLRQALLGAQSKGGLTLDAIIVAWLIAVSVAIGAVFYLVIVLADRVEQLRKAVVGG